MRVGIIGLGSIGTRHARTIAALGHDVFAVDPRLHDSGDPWMWCVDLSTLVSMRPAAIAICTPAATHAGVAQELAALKYGGPLFVEKPLALSSAECAVFRSWPSSVTMVGYMLRHHAVSQAMRRLFPAPTFGDFYSGCDTRTWKGTAYGPFLLEASHELDLALWLGLPVERISLSQQDDESLAVWAGGSQWRVEIHDHQEYCRSWRVGVRQSRQRHDRSTASLSELKWTVYSPEELGDQMYVDELAHFLSCVEANTPTLTPFADGIRVLEVCERATHLAKESECPVSSP